MEEVAGFKKSFDHNLVNSLYIIKGIAESHLDALQKSSGSSVPPNAPPAELLERTKQALSCTLEHANKVIGMIQHLRAMTSPEPAAHCDRTRHSTSLEDVVRDVLHAMHYEYPLERIAFLKIIPSDLPLLAVAREHLEAILFQLIYNARQAIGGPAGVITLEAQEKEVASREELERRIRIRVSDTGPGIPEPYLPFIYDPFFTTKDSKSGNGLGLYLVKRLVDLNGGFIRVATSKSGTSFELELPA